MCLRDSAIGVDKDQKSENPDVVVCSMLKHVGESVYQAVAQYIDAGVFNGGAIWDADLSTGLVGIGSVSYTHLDVYKRQG